MKDLDVYEKIRFLLKSESIRKTIADALGFPNMPDDVVAWTAVFFKDKTLRGFKKLIPEIEKEYIEVYADKILEGATADLDEIIVQILCDLIMHTLVHELIHVYAREPDELRTENATLRLMFDRPHKLRIGEDFDAYYWNKIPCPIDKKDVSWQTCLACHDRIKHSDCPLRNVRLDFQPRKYVFGEYHVTELAHPRYSYYNRLIPTVQSWNDIYDMLYGKALGWYIQSKYGEHKREVGVEQTFVRIVNYKEETIKVVGSADLIDDDTERGYELKFYYSISRLVKSGKPNPDHEFQLRAYYTLGNHCMPYIFNRISRLTLIYYSKMKTKNTPRRKEFELKLEPVDVETPAWKLHNALKIGEPPQELCPSWLCRYCPKEMKQKCGEER